MVKTTVYLPEELKRRLEQTATQQRRPEAEVIREAVDRYTAGHPPGPRLPLFDGDGLAPDLAERVDELLANGFGRD